MNTDHRPTDVSAEAVRYVALHVAPSEAAIRQAISKCKGDCGAAIKLLRDEPSTFNPADVTEEMVRYLREVTDAPMMQCKRALIETEGGMDKAIELINTRLSSRHAPSAEHLLARIEALERSVSDIQTRLF